MEKGNMKEEILEAALELFAVNGFEATSIAQIADAVGLRKASLYSHYSSKQEILDKMISWVLEGYKQHSIFVRADWDNPDFTKDKENLSAEDIAAMITGQIRYILHDPFISKGRKMFTIEQFRNSELAAYQTKMNYDDVMKFFEGMMLFLIRRNILKDVNPTIMAAQLSAPITVWINLCDREPEREQEVLELVHSHILQFFDLYRK